MRDSHTPVYNHTQWISWTTGVWLSLTIGHIHRLFFGATKGWTLPGISGVDTKMWALLGSQGANSDSVSIKWFDTGIAWFGKLLGWWSHLVSGQLREFRAIASPRGKQLTMAIYLTLIRWDDPPSRDIKGNVPRRSMYGTSTYVCHKNSPSMWVSIPFPLSVMGYG